MSVKGTFFRYPIANGVDHRADDAIAGRLLRAETSVPASSAGPPSAPPATLVRVTTGAYAGWWIEPLASTVKYAGEV